jgi:predicted AlkP superfamily phosphohydrolase/phosphomutase
MNESQSSSRRRVLIIGLDSATFDLIDPWVDSGDLPNLAGLLAQGCCGPLLSTLQPVTAAAWTTFSTGVNQGKHGLYDFVRRRPDSYGMTVTNASHVHAPTIFDIASQHGLRTFAINVPYTYPPRPINGVMVSGPFAPAVTPEIVHPPEFFDTLQAIAPDYFILPDYDSRHPEPMRAYAERLLREVELRQQVALHLMNTQPWDLFMVVIMATDEVQHAYWHCMTAPKTDPAARYADVIRSVYRQADRTVGALLSQTQQDGFKGETVVFVVSDHGAGPLRWLINLNGWLAQAGFLSYRQNRTSLRAGLVKRLASFYRQNAPVRLRAALLNRLGAGHFDQIKGEVESTLFTSSVDWEKTQAYAMGAGGNIYINLKGREPSGMVEPGESYERLRHELSEAISQMRDPTSGEKIVKRVYRKEEIYQGPYLEQAPDLVIEWQDYACWGRGRYDSQAAVFEAENFLEFSTTPLSGAHRREGVLFAQGPGIKPSGRIAGARLLDMAPTILSLLNIAPSPEMDGQILKDLFQDETWRRLQQTLSQENITHSESDISFSPEEEEKISQHLRSLGYL